jgi:F0F1-type ATP synthase membrane subunit b/b'
MSELRTKLQVVTEQLDGRELHVKDLSEQVAFLEQQLQSQNAKHKDEIESLETQHERILDDLHSKHQQQSEHFEATCVEAQKE